MPIFQVSGDISLEQLQEAIKQRFPEKNVVFLDDNSNSSKFKPNRLTIREMSNESDDEKEEKIKELEQTISKSNKSIQSFLRQQQAMFDEFVLLRNKYDEQKFILLTTLWAHCLQTHPDLGEIPEIDESKNIEEENQYGDYIASTFLGEGQFATVRTCTKKHDASRNQEYAIKVIKKEKINTFQGLKRLCTEIRLLKILKSPNIIGLHDVIQTKNFVCLVTDIGGNDLFEFFNQNPNGLSEEWARIIFSQLLRGISFCHEHRICHRDLKPENVLIDFDMTNGVCKSLKICDFGLSCNFSPTTVLNEFCGSPGFFDPEMIIQGNYYGDKCDLWSIGSILLEAILGHELFNKKWMFAYDYDTMKNRDLFGVTIEEVCKKLPSNLPFSDDLNDLLLSCLVIDSHKRITLRHLCKHSWLQDSLFDLNMKHLSFCETTPQYIDDNRFRSEISRKENNQSLPPIKPSKTPCVSSVRKLICNSESNLDDIL